MGAPAGARVLLLAGGLALASYGISWMLFGTLSYAGERADGVFSELARGHLWLAIGHQLELLALHLVVYLALLLVAEGAVRGLEVTRGRLLRHPWGGGTVTASLSEEEEEEEWSSFSFFFFLDCFSTDILMVMVMPSTIKNLSG